MVAPLKVSLVQTDLIWKQPQANREAIQSQIAALAGKTDLIVLPEMFTSGFTTEPDALDDSVTGSPTLDWMKQQALHLQAAITGSTVFNNKNGYTNRMWFVEPDGQASYYDKVHLFRMADEHKRYNPGDRRTCITYRGWRILLTVCYDLRFPVFCRNRNDYDVFLCVASWPSSRRHAWRTLLQSRAIENLSYAIGVNRIGTDGKGWHYSGDSLIADFQGSLVVDREPEQGFVTTHALDYAALQKHREDFPTWKDADDFELHLKQ